MGRIVMSTAPRDQYRQVIHSYIRLVDYIVRDCEETLRAAVSWKTEDRLKMGVEIRVRADALILQLTIAHDLVR